jgi:hypothetical protein
MPMPADPGSRTVVGRGGRIAGSEEGLEHARNQRDCEGVSMATCRILRSGDIDGFRF